MKEENQRLILATIIFGLLGFGIFYMYNVMNTDWNEYWFERFSDGQCENICQDEGMTLQMQSPSYCECSGRSIRRPSTFTDTMVTMFGGWK